MLAAVVTLALALVAAAWWHNRAVPITAKTVRLEPFAERLVASGYLDAERRAALGPLTAGRLTKMQVAPGDKVEAGMELAQFDDAGLKARVASADALVAAATSEAEAARSAWDAALGRLGAAEATLRRQKSLSEQGVVSTSTLEQAQSSRDQASADLASAQAALEAADAQVRSLAANWNEAAEQLSDLTLVAPFEGIVAAVYAREGDVLTAGNPVVEIVDPSRLTVELSVDEVALSRIKPGQPTTVALVSAPARAISGRVSTVDRRLDPDSREGRVTLALDAGPESWAIDARTIATVQLEDFRQALTVPAAWVKWSEGRPFVYILKSDHAQRRDIQLGAPSEEVVEVVSGLAVGDVVVFAEKLTDNRRVETASR
jgi:multidrug efflux pump subunit AcrA (membrane-fusion protein)